MLYLSTTNADYHIAGDGSEWHTLCHTRWPPSRRNNSRTFPEP